MQPLLFILNNYLRGKAIYNPFRRILEVLFSANISSFVFQRFYFNYYWLDITDYKGIIDFFVKGDFFIPFIIFLAVHCGSYFISYILFTLTTNRKSAKWMTGIIKFKLTKKDFNSFAKKLNKNPSVKRSKKIQPSWLLDTYMALKENITAEQWLKAEVFLSEQKLNIEKNFLLISKAIIAVSVFYFFTVPHFGPILYVITLIFFVAALVFLWYSYLVLDILPAIVRKVDQEAQLHLAAEVMASEQISS